MPTAERYLRKVIRIKAEDSPNVQAGRELIPGVLSLAEYEKRRRTWDRVRACVGLDAEFWEGPEALLFPPLWLNRAERIAAELKGRGGRREVKGVGIDTGEGESETCMTATDELGILEQVSKPTPDTNVIPGEALAFMRKWNVPADRVCFDRGGGGKQAADRLRAMGFPVRTVAFGEAVVLGPRRGRNRLRDRLELQEDRSVFANRRAQMFGEASELLDPGREGSGYGIPAELTELRRQLAMMPKMYDGEGKLRMLPKSRRSENSTEKTLMELLGCSPDRADSWVLSVHSMLHRERRVKAGAV